MGVGVNAFIAALGMLIMKAVPIIKDPRVIATATGVSLATDAIDLPNFFRQQALRLAPGSDANALEELARLAMRLIGAENGAIFWPRDRISGEPIPPLYMVLDFQKGRGWFTSRNPASRRRSFGGRGRGGGLRTARRYMMRYRR